MTEAQYQAAANAIAANLPEPKLQAAVGDQVMKMVATDLTGYGKVILLKKKDCIVLVADGKKERMPLEFPATIGDTTYMLTKELPALVEDAAKPARTPRQRAEAGQPTKIQVCRELYAANPSFTREQMIELFVNEGKCTPAGAVTYYSTCKKG